MIGKEILGTLEHSRKELLERKRTETSEPKLTFNIIYNPFFQKRHIARTLFVISS